MYINHSQLQLPFSDDCSIWKFMSFGKFMAMLKNKSLFFCRLDRLSDPWEGVYPRGYIDYWKSMIPDKIPSSDGKQYDFIQWIREKELPTHFVNCWYTSDSESFAMWRLYTYGGEGVAIKSTIGRFKACFKTTQERIWIGKVSYVNYDTWSPPKSKRRQRSFSWIEPFFLKRKCFEHECEVRALINKASKKQNYDIGFNVSIDVTELIECIYVDPNAKKWFIDLVELMVSIEPDLKNVSITKSSLGDRPWE